MTTTHANHRNLTTTLSNGYKVDTAVLIGECPAFPTRREYETAVFTAKGECIVVNSTTDDVAAQVCHATWSTLIEYAPMETIVEKLKKFIMDYDD